MSNFREALYVFTERLYKYRAFVAEETFTKLHSFKRRLQDFCIDYDAATRYLDKSPFLEWQGNIKLDNTPGPMTLGKKQHEVIVERHQDIRARAESDWEKVDELYMDITKQIKAQLESYLPTSLQSTGDKIRNAEPKASNGQ